MSEAEKTPRPPMYRSIETLQVGPVVLELADRTEFTRVDEKPRVEIARVLTIGVGADCTSEAQVLAIAAALRALAPRLSVDVRAELREKMPEG